MKRATTHNKIVVYQAKSGAIELRGDFGKETLWATQAQIADIFQVERSVVTKHVRNILQDKELDPISVCAKFAHTADDGKVYQVQFYNLDVILAVGYRTSSQRAIDFRKWATKTLRHFITHGYAINEKKLLEAKRKFAALQEAVAFLSEKSKKQVLVGQEGEILSLLASYAKTLSILDAYDKGTLREARGGKGKCVLTYEKCMEIISEVKQELVAKKEASDLFGRQKDDSFKGVVGALYQTFEGRELYATLESKAAHVLYLTIKDHPFSDGNKRIASFLFVYFLDKNNSLYRDSGEKKINDNALAALALLIAASDPNEKEVMIALITQLLR